MKGFTLKSGAFKENSKRADNYVKGLKGFTLIELLVVLGVLSMTVGAITIFLTSVLRGTNKANASAEVKQNSQTVLDSLERQIRGAVSVEEVIDPGGDHIILERSTGGSLLHIKCHDNPTSTQNPRISIQVSDILPVNEADYISVSNADPINGVSIENCRLKAFPETGSGSGSVAPALVQISFDVVKESDRVDSTAKTSVQTTISLRRY